MSGGRPRADLMGQVFGRLTVVGRAPDRLRSDGRARGASWHCRCECGSDSVVETYDLTSGHSTSCGCEGRGKFEDLTGRVFGRLTVTGPAPTKVYPNGRKVLYWDCLCECGGVTRVPSVSLTRERTKSCGCLASELARERTTGSAHHLFKHGKSRLPEHNSWAQARMRCSETGAHSHKDYFGRGITMCQRWQDSFEAFIEDMGPKPPDGTLDRIDNNGNYEPGNCRWITQKEQCRNKRNNVRLEIDGVTKTLAEWAEISPVTDGAIRRRLARGWTPREAVYLPPRWDRELGLLGEQS